MDNSPDLLLQRLGHVKFLAVGAEKHGLVGDVGLALGDLVDLITGARFAQRSAVALLRAEGWTWQQIGDVLGISRQSAHEQFGP